MVDKNLKLTSRNWAITLKKNEQIVKDIPNLFILKIFGISPLSISNDKPIQNTGKIKYTWYQSILLIFIGFGLLRELAFLFIPDSVIYMAQFGDITRIWLAKSFYFLIPIVNLYFIAFFNVLRIWKNFDARIFAPFIVVKIKDFNQQYSENQISITRRIYLRCLIYLITPLVSFTFTYFNYVYDLKSFEIADLLSYSKLGLMTIEFLLMFTCVGIVLAMVAHFNVACDVFCMKFKKIEKHVNLKAQDHYQSQSARTFESLKKSFEIFENEIENILDANEFWTNSLRSIAFIGAFNLLFAVYGWIYGPGDKNLDNYLVCVCIFWAVVIVNMLFSAYSVNYVAFKRGFDHLYRLTMLKLDISQIILLKNERSFIESDPAGFTVFFVPATSSNILGDLFFLLTIFLIQIDFINGTYSIGMVLKYL